MGEELSAILDLINCKYDPLYVPVVPVSHSQLKNVEVVLSKSSNNVILFSDGLNSKYVQVCKIDYKPILNNSVPKSTSLRLSINVLEICKDPFVFVEKKEEVDVLEKSFRPFSKSKVIQIESANNLKRESKAKSTITDSNLGKRKTIVRSNDIFKNSDSRNNEPPILPSFLNLMTYESKSDCLPKVLEVNSTEKEFEADQSYKRRRAIAKCDLCGSKEKHRDGACPYIS